MRERERLELQKFMAEEAALQKQKEAAENLERLKREVALNASRAIKAQHKLLLGKRETPPVSQTVMYISFQNEQEKEQWQSTESQAFRLAHPEYEKYRSDETINQLVDVYRAHYRGEGTPILCREMLAYAFAKCLEEGTLLENTRSDVTEPINTRSNVSEEVEEFDDFSDLPRLDINDIRPSLGWTRDLGDSQVGRDLVNGGLKEYTPFEIERLTSYEYRKIFSGV
jgi:hypothetical protein